MLRGDPRLHLHVQALSCTPAEPMLMGVNLRFSPYAESAPEGGILGHPCGNGAGRMPRSKCFSCFLPAPEHGDGSQTEIDRGGTVSRSQHCGWKALPRLVPGDPVWADGHGGIALSTWIGRDPFVVNRDQLMNNRNPLAKYTIPATPTAMERYQTGFFLSSAAMDESRIAI